MFFLNSSFFLKKKARECEAPLHELLNTTTISLFPGSNLVDFTFQQTFDGNQALFNAVIQHHLMSFTVFKSVEQR